MTKNTNSDKSFRVRRGRVDSVNLYEVKENELEILENGDSNNLQLNFSIFLLSVAFSGTLALCTATFASSVLQNTFLFVTIVGFILGLYLILVWWKGRKSINMIIKTIKDRIEPEIVKEGEDEIEVNREPDNPMKETDIIPPEG